MSIYKKIDTEEEYAMEYTCPNCGETFVVMIPKGERAHQGKCPRCKVYPTSEPILEIL